MAKEHPDHSTEIHRIKRIIGQLEGVQKMIVERRYCMDILNQTKAITSAIHSLESALLEKHLHHCVLDSFAHTDSHQDEKQNELLELFKKRIK